MKSLNIIKKKKSRAAMVPVPKPNEEVCICDSQHRLRTVLDRLKSTGLVLNKNKCVFSTNEIKFPDCIINHENVRGDSKQVEALVNFITPKYVRLQ